MNVLDLFSGIGGFSLGLERAGMRTVAFCEIDPYCQRVLRKHWPTVPIYDDVRTLTAENLGIAKGNGCGARRQGRLDSTGAGEQQSERPLQIDLICGGFPCQDISIAGKGAGIGGERSGLWSEYARIIGEVRPRYIIVENVAALLGRGIERVLGDLAALGYDAEWHCIPASAIGAPHRRDRVWIVAYTSNSGREQLFQSVEQCGGSIEADAGGNGEIQIVADADSKPTRRLAIAWGECGQWLTEPDVGRVANGIPARVDRLRALGNAVVPQIVEIIGRAIMEADGHRQAVTR